MQNFFAILHIVPKHDLQWLMKHDMWGFPSGSVVKKICLQYRRHGFNPWVGKIPWKGKWQPTPVFLLGEFYAEEPGRLQSTGLQRTGHDVGTKSHQPLPQMMMRNKWRNRNEERESGGPFFHHCVQNYLDLVAGDEGSDLKCSDLCSGFIILKVLM